MMMMNLIANKSMNRFITISIVASLAVGMLSCTKEAPVEDNVVSGSSFTVFASAAETKTAVNDEMNGVVWSDGDQLNIFHAPAGKTVYVPDGSFTFSEGIKFNGEVTGELSSTNDWYAIYPYKEQITTPASTEGGYQYIGSRSDKSQTQDGNDSMAHLAGTNYPLYGVAKAVAKDETPSFTMEQLCSVVAIKVTNTTNKPLTVSSVSFTGTENIVGTFFVDFTGNTPSFSDGPHVGTEASLTVNNAEPLSNGEYATYYIAIKPFKAGAESKLYVSVNGYSKEIAIEKETSFTSGKIKKINFAYDNTASDFTWNLAEDNTSIASDTRLYWYSDCATMLVEKGTSTTATNNYHPGTVDKTYNSTRFYSGSEITILPSKGVTVSRVVFEATTNAYANALSSSTWTNAESSVSATTVTVTPTDGTQAITATITGTCGFTSVVVYYKGEPDKTIYNVTVASDIPGGTVTANPASAKAGSIITLTASPASNYQFDSWTVTNSSTNEPITVTDAEFIMPASDVIVSASFKGKTTSTEPFEWNGGGKNSLTEMEGVTGYGLGSDYAAANAPYQVKLDNTGDYIIIELAYEIASVQLKAKMIGGASSSSIMIQESDSKTGTFTDVQEMTISGSLNDVIDFTTSTMFKSGSRAVKLYFTKGANIGLGYIKIAPKK